MGQAADDLVDGTVCSICGQFFVESRETLKMDAVLYSHGFPAVCWECWEKLTKKERKQHQRALKPTL